MIFHLTSFAEWNKAQTNGEYTAPSLKSEGFIHFSAYGQILKVANSFYKSVQLPILLVVDNSKLLDIELRWEGADGLEFPHLYRSLKCSEVTKTIPLLKNKNGDFVSSEDLDQAAGAKTLETPRLILREMQLADFPYIHAYASDEENGKYMPWGPNNENDTRAFLTRKFKEQASSPRKTFDFGVIDKTTGQFMGACGFMVKSYESQVGFIGYVLKKTYHGRGFATEFSKALLQFGFDELKMHRIEATCDSENIGSFKVMQKIGMQQEALLRGDAVYKGRRRSTIICSIVRD